MSLQHRLNAMERRIRELEEWRASIEQAIEDEEAPDEPIRTLDGEQDGGERDQMESLG